MSLAVDPKKAGLIKVGDDQVPPGGDVAVKPFSETFDPPSRRAGCDSARSVDSPKPVQSPRMRRKCPKLRAEGGRFEPGAADHGAPAPSIDGADDSAILRTKLLKPAEPKTALNDPEEPV